MQNIHNEKPLFSIVIPTYNRLAYLKKCIHSFNALKYNNYEVIIVNDGSSDNTYNFLKNIKNKKIKTVHHKKNLGIATARNTGIKHSLGTYIAFTDDDCLIDPNWLTQLEKSFNNSKADFIIGRTFYIKQGYKGYFPERLVQNPQANWPMTCNLSFKKQALAQIGFFNSSFKSNSDTELSLRAINYGLTYSRSQTAIIYHQAINWSPRSLLRSAQNASVWPRLKKTYPKKYQHFKPNILFNFIIEPKDYFLIIILPILLPLLLIRYLYHGKRNLKIFFCKWPLWLFLRRYYIWKSAIQQKIFMI